MKWIYLDFHRRTEYGLNGLTRHVRLDGIRRRHHYSMDLCEMLVPLTREGIEMVIAISLGITPLHFGVYEALPDGLFGNFFIIGPFFLFILASRTDGLMIIDRENSGVCWRQLPLAAMTLDRTG